MPINRTDKSTWFRHPTEHTTAMNINKLQLPSTVWMVFHKHTVQGKKSDPKQYPLGDSIYIKFKKQAK